MSDAPDSALHEQRFKVDDADSYNAVVDYFDQYTERFTSHLPGPLLSMAHMPAGGEVLDVGTGTGIIALAAAGQGGHVTGIDLSDGMLATAAAKAGRLGLDGSCRFLKMDAENLDFTDNSFDAAVSLYALRHFPDPGKALREIHRVLRPGARVVVAVGSPPSLLSADGIRAALRRIASGWRKSRGRELQACEFIDGLVEKYIPERQERDVSAWSEHHHGFTGSVSALVRDAGFGEIRADWKGQYSVIESPEDFWLLQMTFSSIARKRIQDADSAQVERLRNEFDVRCRNVLERHGRLVYQTGAAIVAGTKVSG